MVGATHNEKTFISSDVKLFTVYSKIADSVLPASPLHAHSQYELFVFASGSGYVQGRESRMRFSKNTAILISPHTEHSIVAADSPVACISITFNYKKVGDGSKRGGDRLSEYFERLMPKERSIILLKDKYFGKFERSFASKSEADPKLASLLIANMLEGLFLHIIRLLNNAKKKGEDVSIFSYKSHAISNDVILERNIEYYMNSPSCTLSGLAKYLNMCPRNTQKVLQKIFGRTFSEMSADRRLTRAVHLMETTELQLLEIAKNVGYNQYASFRKAFIARYGKSPSAYREALAPVSRIEP